ARQMDADQGIGGTYHTRRCPRLVGSTVHWASMPTYQRGDASIYFEEHGSGFPLLLLSPGGLNSTIDFWSRMPFNPLEEFQSEYRVIAMDQRNAGRSRGPLPVDDPWGGYADDQLG